MSEGEEQRQPTKAELFEQNPDLFMNVDELPLFVTRDPESGKIKNVSIRIKNYEEACLVEIEVRDALNAFRYALKMQAQKKKIITPNGNGKFFDALRGRKN